jgi:hypothetical protein
MIAEMNYADVTAAMKDRGSVKEKDPVAKEEYDKLLKRYLEVREQPSGIEDGGAN